MAFGFSSMMVCKASVWSVTVVEVPPLALSTCGWSRAVNRATGLVVTLASASVTNLKYCTMAALLPLSTTVNLSALGVTPTLPSSVLAVLMPAGTRTIVKSVLPALLYTPKQ